MWGTVHRTCLNSVKAQKSFPGSEEPGKLFLCVGPMGRALTLLKRPVCCVDTQPAGLCFTTFEFWEPGADLGKGARHGHEGEIELSSTNFGEIRRGTER